MKKAILILLFILITAYPCSAKGNARREVKRGNALYGKGRFRESLERYENASSVKPNSGIVNYNIGTASYKLNDYEKAANSFNRALIEEENELSRQASYNLANSEYMLGISKENSNLQEAIGLLIQSLRHYEKSLELDKEDKDAIFNYEYVKKELKRLQKKQQQKKEKKPQDSDRERMTERPKEVPSRKSAKSSANGQEQQEQQKQQKEEKEKQKEKEEREEKEKAAAVKEKEEKEGQEPQDKEPQQGEPQEEMSDKQAHMLLDNYHHDEEPKGLYKQRIKASSIPVDKDW
jgi:Ca-activated chloride channel family protein